MRRKDIQINSAYSPTLLSRGIAVQAAWYAAEGSVFVVDTGPAALGCGEKPPIAAYLTPAPHAPRPSGSKRAVYLA